MKRILLIIFLLFTSLIAGRTSPGIAQELLPEPVIIPVTQPKSLPTCSVGGCSGELCVDEEKGPHYSICLWKEEYACLKHAVCEIQSGGNCGWTYTDAYDACIYGSEPPQPTPKPGNAYCGNNVCEPGEADESWCPPCPAGQKICPMSPCYFNPGSCPSDCPSLPPAPTPPLCKDILCPTGTSLSETCECRPIVSSGDGTSEENEGSEDSETGKTEEEGPPDPDETNREKQSGQQNGSNSTPENISPTDEEVPQEEAESQSVPPTRSDFLKRFMNFFRRFDIYLDWFF